MRSLWEGRSNRCKIACMESRQGLHEQAAQEQIQSFMAQVHRQLLADQSRRVAVGGDS